MAEYKSRGYDGKVIWVPLGDRGLEPNTNPARVPTSAAIVADTVTYFQDSVRKARGTQKISAIYDTTTNGTTLAMADWWPTEGSQHWIRATSKGLLFHQSSPAVAASQPQNGTSTSLGTSNVLTAFFVQAGDEAVNLTDPAQYKKLFCFTGISPLRYYDGTNEVATTVAHPAEDWTGSNQPVGGTLHNGALWAWGPNGRPHALYRSRLTDHAYFASELITATSTQFFTVTPGVGRRLWSGQSHKGLLFLFKSPIGIAWLDDSDINPGGWRLTQLTDSVGVAPSPYSTVLLDDGILGMTATGEFFLLTATTQGGVELVNLSNVLNLTPWLRENVDVSKLALMSSTWDASRKEALFSVTSTDRSITSETNNLILKFDFSNLESENGKPRFSYSTRDTARALGSRRSETTSIITPVFADYSGVEWQYDDARSLDRGNTTPTVYASAFQLPHSSLIEFATETRAGTMSPYIGSMNKLFDFLDIEYIPTDSMGPLLVTTYVDGVQTDQFTISLTPAGNALDALPLATDGETPAQAPLSVLAERVANSVAMVRHRITGEGRRISVRFEHTVAANTYGDDFNITGLYISFRDGGQDTGRHALTG